MSNRRLYLYKYLIDLDIWKPFICFVIIFHNVIKTSFNIIHVWLDFSSKVMTTFNNTYTGVCFIGYGTKFRIFIIFLCVKCHSY